MIRTHRRALMEAVEKEYVRKAVMVEEKSQ